jgi:hypothetical protein
VSDFPPVLQASSAAKQIVSITDLFRNDDKVDEESLIDAPSQPEIFVTPSDGESLGDLTMTTYEQLVESGAVLRPCASSDENAGAANQEGTKQTTGPTLFSFFSCGSADGYFESTPVPQVATPAAREGPKGQLGRRARRIQATISEDENTQGDSLRSPPTVSAEMRAAAEAAWAKRSAEMRRCRPPPRTSVGYEI